MLDAQTKDIVKSTAPLLKDYSQAIGSRFYELLFDRVPELYNMFNQTNQKRGIQQEALAYAVYAAGENLDQLENIQSLVERVAQKHVALGVKPEQYPIVGEALLQAVKDVFGDAATDEIMAAWREAYQAIADVFIQLEGDLYKQKEQNTGDWTGFRDFYVANKIKETDTVTSFYLRPKDGGPLASFQPGQYLTLKADIDGETYTHMRHYSLSEAPNQDYYRISVKREYGSANHPDGVVSHFLHEQVDEGHVLPLAAPAGDFRIMSEELPVVFISGGIGITPLMNMLNTMAQSPLQRPITFIHATQNSASHVMKSHVEQLAARHPNISAYFCYDDPSSEDQVQGHFDKTGYVSLAWLQSILPDQPADFYFCGPVPFMQVVEQALKDWGVPEERRHFEVFNPVTVLAKA